MDFPNPKYFCNPRQLAIRKIVNIWWSGGNHQRLGHQRHWWLVRAQSKWNRSKVEPLWEPGIALPRITLRCKSTKCNEILSRLRCSTIEVLVRTQSVVSHLARSFPFCNVNTISWFCVISSSDGHIPDYVLAIISEPKDGVTAKKLSCSWLCAMGNMVEHIKRH